MLKDVKSIPPTDKEVRDFFIKAGWKRIKEPSNLPVAILLSLFFPAALGISGLLRGVIVFLVLLNAAARGYRFTWLIWFNRSYC